MNEQLEKYITHRSKDYPGAIEGWMVREMTDAVQEALDILYQKIRDDKPYGGAKERIYELMDEILEIS